MLRLRHFVPDRCKKGFTTEAQRTIKNHHGRHLEPFVRNTTLAGACAPSLYRTSPSDYKCYVESSQGVPEASAHLRELFESQANRDAPEALEVGQRWLHATLRSDAQGNIGEVVKRLAEFASTAEHLREATVTLEGEVSRFRLNSVS